MPAPSLEWCSRCWAARPAADTVAHEQKHVWTGVAWAPGRSSANWGTEDGWNVLCGHPGNCPSAPRHARCTVAELS